jgi:hypothetical protein
MKDFLPLLIGIASAIAGYLIINFWYRPILRFLDIKSQIMSDLVYYENATVRVPRSTALKISIPDRVIERLEVTRRHSADLLANFNELPSWYKLYLKQRNFEIEKAVEELLILSNYPDINKGEPHLRLVRQHLKIKELE